MCTIVASIVNEGDTVDISLEASRKAYLVVYYLESDGKAELLWPSAEEPEQLAAELKEERYQRLMEHQRQISLTKNRAMVGRELEVLHLVAAGKSNRQIADELVLATGTVKKHLNNIFGKLNVESRTQCIARIRELNLL